MEMALGMSETDVNETSCRGTDVGHQLQSVDGWNQVINGTNSSGFSGLPGGHRSVNEFQYAGVIGFWWSASSNGSQAWCRSIGSCQTGGIYRGDLSPGDGFSVRCIKDIE